ncbi:CASP-like protein 1C2 [Striga hermonthica]|uniref:CASP-like protein n=1 Tax=Striga hermonthica TaxID=68872 RepID=A0A9N7N7H6_STRHE|nr:CASP-like protein 1C2 [Striga hermonthica]
MPKLQETGSKIMFFYFSQLVLRILVIAFTLGAAIIMATSQQTVTFFGIAMDARYSYSSSFRFNLVANCVACGLTVLSVILVISLNPSKSNPNKYFYLLLHDMLSLVLLLSGTSAAMAIGYVGRYGQSKTGWMPVCDRVAKFCDKIIASIVSSFVALICLVLLTIMSAHKLKSHAYSHGI